MASSHLADERLLAGRIEQYHAHELITKLIKLYLERCKLKHSLAFMQFRTFLPGADVQEINENFEGRQKFFIRQVT